MAKLKPKELPKHFWNEEKGLTSMFILLCVSNFVVIPFFSRENIIIYLLLRVFWFILLFTGISTLAKEKSLKRKLSILPALLILSAALRYFLDSSFIDYFELLVELMVFALLIGMVMVKVFEGGSVTMHRVIGSIVAYMLIGNAWAQIYEFLFIHFPGSLQVPVTFNSTGVPNSVFLYFSYSTLTTTGYGDILPLSAVTRTLSIIEQLIGVLYPVVLIGRLVSLIVIVPREQDKH
jgi:hypothetical protein